MSMILDLMRAIHASTKFKIDPDFQFIEFEDLTADYLRESEATPEILEIMAKIKIKYEGEPPESYKALNLMIGDWAESNMGKLTTVVHEKLLTHFKQFYPNSDASDLEQVDDTAIWEDQLDFMPDINPDKKTMILHVELILEGDPEDTPALPYAPIVKAEEEEETQLEKGTKVEEEHGDVFGMVKGWFEGMDKKVPIEEHKFYEMIAKAHLKELPDYYDRLLKMEGEH